MSDTTKDAVPLKPCPFCGEAAYFFKIVDEESSDFGGEGVVCTSCNASTGLRFACGDEVKQFLAETWNRRAPAQVQAGAVRVIGYVPSYIIDEWKAGRNIHVHVSRAQTIDHDTPIYATHAPSTGDQS